MCLIDDPRRCLKIHVDLAARFRDLKTFNMDLMPFPKTCRVADDDGGGVPQMVADEVLFNGPDDEPRSWVTRHDV